MHRFAVIERGKTREKKKLVNGNQEFSLHMLRHMVHQTKGRYHVKN